MLHSGLYKLDWPEAAGGPGLPRPVKLDMMKTACDAACPLAPESLSLLAPLLISIGKPDLLQVPGLLFESHLSIDGESIYLKNASDSEQLANGNIDQLLSTAFSPLYLIYDMACTLREIRELKQLWDHHELPGVEELEIKLDAMQVQYLKDQPALDLQIALTANRCLMPAYDLLFQSLGYYALLDPDPRLTANEHVPFRRSRQHLKDMRSRIGRSDMLQQDMIFERMLGGKHEA